MSDSWVSDSRNTTIDTLMGLLRARGAKWVKVLATGRAFGYQGYPSRRLFSDDELRAIVVAAAKRGLWVGAHAHGDEGMRAAVLAGVRTIVFRNCGFI